MTYEPRRLPPKRNVRDLARALRAAQEVITDLRRARDAAALDAQRWRTVRFQLTITLDSTTPDGHGPFRHMLRFATPSGTKLIPGSGNVPVPPVTDTLLDAAVDALQDARSYGETLSQLTP